MSSSDIAVSVRGLSKSYTIAHNAGKHTTAAEALVSKLRNPFHKTEKEMFWALKDVEFDIKKGDVVGIIGRNGAGKSTLLKILSRITEPTMGRIALYGRVGSLLEVGTGFHPELTGRENIYLNGAILGMSKREIARHFDAIVDFAGVEQFLDTPVKRYSSGMYVRLAFAVAAHLASDILVVDEVLAVGDAEFQRKCLGKMKDVAHSGRTVLFVSHHMQSVSVLCNRAMFLEKGTTTFLGDVPGAIDCYMRSFEKTATEVTVPARRPGTGELRITSITPDKEFYTCGEEKTIRYTVQRFSSSAGKFFVSCHIVDDYGATILHCDSRMVGQWMDAADSYDGEFTLRTPWLKPGNYRVDMFICSMGVLDKFEDACRLQVQPLLPYSTAGNTEATAHGVVFADYTYNDTEPLSEKTLIDFLAGEERICV
jgi:lipopolysaccharide transport system ATP-binding protein